MRERVVRPAVLTVVAGTVLAWFLLTVLDLQDADGAAPIIAMFAIPALVSAVVFQLVVDRPKDERFPRAVMVWIVLIAFPLAILGGFVVAILREPDYFVGDEGPWMLVWIPLFVAVALLGGVIVNFFLVFPIVLAVRILRGIRRGETRPAALLLPAVLFTLGVVAVIGGLSLQTGTVGQPAQALIVMALLGVPGPYEIHSELGLWIVRGLLLAIVAVIIIPFVLGRRAERHASAGGALADPEV